MEINSINLTRIGYASVLMLCGLLTVGCAGNAAKPVNTVTAHKQEAIKMEKEINIAMTKSAEEVSKFPGIDISENTQPKQMAFFFRFDKATLDAADVEVIKQHAKFMLDNPGLLLKIDGHTDQHGPHAYNEYLSKKRADEVVKILISEGVTESQLVISALASDQPLQGESDKRKNRRVELEYNELNLVSNH